MEFAPIVAKKQKKSVNVINVKDVLIIVKINNMTSLNTHIPLKYIKQSKELQEIKTEEYYVNCKGKKASYIYAVNHKIDFFWSAPTIADIIDNAEMLFRESGYYSNDKFTGIKTMKEACDRVEEFKHGLWYKCHKETAVCVLRMCQQNKPIEEISEYIIKNIK